MYNLLLLPGNVPGKGDCTQVKQIQEFRDLGIEGLAV